MDGLAEFGGADRLGSARVAKQSAVLEASGELADRAACVGLSLAQTHVSNVLVRALAEVAQRRGVAPETLVGGAAEAIFGAAADGRVTLGEYQALMARAIQLTSDPALGLQCTLIASESSFGLMSPLVGHAASLREAIQLVSQFHPLMLEGVSIQLSERIGTARLRCQVYAPVSRSVLELVVAGLVRMLRAFGCGEAELRAVCFSYARPAYHHAYTAAFGGAERFAQPFTGVEFCAPALDRPHMHREPGLHALMRAQAERSLERLARPLTCVERIRAFLDGQRATQLPDMFDASRELGISVRSLRRRLEEEGTSYRELTRAKLYDSACSMLRNPELTLQSIAHALGFADASTFHRAFKRWSGSTPAEYRARAPRSFGQVGRSGKQMADSR